MITFLFLTNFFVGGVFALFSLWLAVCYHEIKENWISSFLAAVLPAALMLANAYVFYGQL